MTSEKISLLPLSPRIPGFIILVLLLTTNEIFAQPITIPDRVRLILSENCVICHGGGAQESGLDLQPEHILSATLNQPSREKPQMFLIKPADPDSSYLIMKIRHDPSILGSPMPFGREKLPDESIEALTDWISFMIPTIDSSDATPIPRKSFEGWTVGNVPTTEVLNEGRFLFSIKHRFAPKIGKEANFWGIDGPAIIMMEIGYAPRDNLLVMVGRTNASDDVEIKARYRLMKEQADRRLVSLAVQATVNWESRKIPGQKRFGGDVLMYTCQAIVSKTFSGRFSGVAVPCILVNPDPGKDGEEMLVTLGMGGRVILGNGYSFIGDVVQIVSGFAGTPSIYSLYRTSKRYDSWTLGVEKVIGYHVFQVFATNSEGISQDQYLNGGDLDIRDREARLGFTIYRLF